MDRDNRLGEYLRARRELLSPLDVGLATTATTSTGGGPTGAGRRRVPGLRREELALLAGISTDYYVRLEQGASRRPSEQVLDALARVLDLDDEATAHLHRLARPAPSRRAPARPETAPTYLPGLLRAWSDTPAYLLGRYWDVLAANPLATALHPGYRPGVNLLRTIFLDPDAAEFYLDWPRLTRGSVAALRASAAPDLDHPRLVELVGELSLHSETFRRLWSRHDVRGKAHLTKRLRHPAVGDLELHFVSLAVTGAPGQQLVAYHAEPDTPSAQALSLLATFTADRPPASRGSRHTRPGV